MTGVEDLLRAAAREKATEITPGSIPPLDVAELARRRDRGRRRLGMRIARWPRLAVPLAAATAVVAVVALSIAVPRMLTGHGAADGGTATGPTASATSGPTGGDAIPPYYIALTSASSQPDEHPLRITVRSTMTGAPVATVRAPAPYGTFSLVARGAVDDTFVVGVQPWRSPGETSMAGSTVWVKLMLLHFHPATKSVSFSALAVPTVSLAALQSVALSPDGKQLAIALAASPTLLDLDVFSLTGGGRRTWSLRGAQAGQWSIEDADAGASGGGTNPNAMSWLPDGRTLAFNLSQLRRGKTLAETVRELDVDGSGGGLLADSRAVFDLNRSSRWFECLDALQLSADGTTVTCAGYGEQIGSDAPTAPAIVIVGFAVFSVATGQLTTVRAQLSYRPLPAVPRLFWQGGDTLIGTLRGSILIVSGGDEHVTPWDPPTGGQTQGDAVDAAW